MHEQWRVIFLDAESMVDAIDEEIARALEAFMRVRPCSMGEIASVGDFIAMRYMIDKIREGTKPEALAILDGFYEEWKARMDKRIGEVPRA